MTTRKITLHNLRNRLAKVGVTMTDEQFSQLTYKELKIVLRKSIRAYGLYSQVDAIITRNPVQTPKIPLEKNKKSS